MANARQTLGGGRPAFSYAHNVPNLLAATLSRAIEEYASKSGKSIQFEPWYQGLPIWIVRESNSRTNKVQVEVVEHDGRTLISFTPDAFEDIERSSTGLRELTRKIPRETEILKRRQVLPLEDIVQQSDRGEFTAQRDALGLVSKVLDAVLLEAAALELDDRVSVEHKTPFA